MTDCDKCKEYDKEKNYCPVFCNVINDVLTDRTIYELEDIKAEIENIDLVYEKNGRATIMKNFDDIKSEIFDILDKHISELKGE